MTRLCIGSLRTLDSRAAWQVQIVECHMVMAAYNFSPPYLQTKNLWWVEIIRQLVSLGLEAGGGNVHPVTPART